MQKIVILLFTLSLGCNLIGKNESVQKSTNRIDTVKKADTLKLDFDTPMNELKKELSGDFIYRKSSYFLVVSNLSETETDKLVSNTIERTVICFYNNYFEKKPDDVTTIFLFNDDKSYRYWAKKLFDDDDLSRFGYYKPSKKTMLMNISTGSGTLVHEMTHSLVRFDFPDITSWFNEGLGSLYERSSLNDGNILGYVNWRLPRLQESFTDGTYTSLASLMKDSEENFYGKNSDLNYAQARYLCMYMQEKGVLKNFYKSYRDGFENDKSGIKTIESVFGKNINSIDKEYVEWVKTLKYE